MLAQRRQEETGKTRAEERAEMLTERRPQRDGRNQRNRDE